MASRALIIAIENYLDAEGIARQLPGTLDAAIEFNNWLKSKWAAEGVPTEHTQVLLCTEPVQPGGVGASRADIIDSLVALKEKGKNQTEELFVFFSGHGFSFVQRPGARADVIITADYRSPTLSGHCCLNLDEIIGWLRDYLGPGCHYYFVDACRNRLDGTMVSVGSLPPVSAEQNAADPTTFVLQSTTEGTYAEAAGPFPDALRDGLKGQGKAKVWDPRFNGAMCVRFDSLRLYIRSRMEGRLISHSVRGEMGEGEVVLRTLRPIPSIRVQIDISGPVKGGVGTLTVARGRLGAPVAHSVTAWPVVLSLEPDDYLVRAEIRGQHIEPANGIKIDAYDDCTITFTANSLTPPALDAWPSRGDFGDGRARFPEAEREEPEEEDGEASIDLAEVHIIVPRECFVRMRNVALGTVDEFRATSTYRLAGGRYSVALRRIGSNTLLKKVDIEVSVRERNSIDLTAWSKSVPQSSIANQFPTRDDLPDFSESLGGPMVDPDIDIWLAVIGAGRILKGLPFADLKKIASLPLSDFADATPNGCLIYVLAGFEKTATKLEVKVDHLDSPGDWLVAKEPRDMPGIREIRIPVAPGHNFVTFRIDDGASYTLASFGLSNRAMLITLSVGRGDYHIAQYLLPIGSLFEYLQASMERRLINYGSEFGRNHLADVLFLAEASRAFRQRKNLGREFQNDRLRELLDTKWLDPIGSTMVCYELLRRGGGAQVGSMVIRNLLQHYGDLPDTQCIADMMFAPGARWAGVPLFQDGLRAYPSFYNQLPYPRSHLDFSSMWTAWRGLADTRVK